MRPAPGSAGVSGDPERSAMRLRVRHKSSRACWCFVQLRGSLAGVRPPFRPNFLGCGFPAACFRSPGSALCPEPRLLHPGRPVEELWARAACGPGARSPAHLPSTGLQTTRCLCPWGAPVLLWLSCSHFQDPLGPAAGGWETPGSQTTAVLPPACLTLTFPVCKLCSKHCAGWSAAHPAGSQGALRRRAASHSVHDCCIIGTRFRCATHPCASHGSAFRDRRACLAPKCSLTCSVALLSAQTRCLHCSRTSWRPRPRASPSLSSGDSP